jgi:hypothetical protein
MTDDDIRREMEWPMEPAVAQPHVMIVARRRLNDGRGHMIRRSRECMVSDRRAAELFVFGFADIPLPEDQDAVLSIIDVDAELLAFIDRKNEKVL